MKHPQPTVMRVRTFVLWWVLAALLLYPLVVTPVMAGYRLWVEHVPLEYLVEEVLSRYGSPWYYQDDLLAATLFCFTVAMAWVQDYLFRRLLQIRLPYWIPLTIVGGGVGIGCMIALKLATPFFVLPWFALMSAAQAWSIRRIAAQWWLWIVAHSALSLLFPLVGEGLELIAQWCVALLIYAVTLLIVLERLAQQARLDKFKPTEG